MTTPDSSVRPVKPARPVESGSGDLTDVISTENSGSAALHDMATERPDPREVLSRIWGFDDFRPLQAEAVRAALAGQDSLTVLPTGGGKSLCYQLPAVCQTGITVVVSPLIALMADQVAALTDRGVAAAAVNSTLGEAAKRQIASDVRAGRLKLLYVAPETLMKDRMLAFLGQQNLACFAIDEAHCISDWGHDFRPEYRTLATLKQRFPGIAVHAFTATATEPVREDIVRALGLTDPVVLVGSFDRPNLTYRVLPRTEMVGQVRAAIDRHRDESGIVYCTKRADVDGLTADLVKAGYLAVGYHAGMSDENRHASYQAFMSERARIIVATVAFGMGIDKSNVRFVIHAAMPKSLEAYQQESGRAGRDSLEAECLLLHGRGDVMTWRRMQDDKSAAAHAIAMTLLDGMDRYATSLTCRHKTLVEYFGQPFENPNCGACDVCLGEVDSRDDSLILAQKILSGIVRTGERFGAVYNAEVLTGANNAKIVDQRHDQLSTHGILAEFNRRDVTDWIAQLLGQNLLQADGQWRTLSVTPAGREVLRGERVPRLSEPAPTRKVKKGNDQSWEGVDRDLFERLRALRRELAEQRSMPPFVVFGDATLRDLARQKPTTRQTFLAAHGVGEAKLKQYGDAFLAIIAAHVGVSLREERLPLSSSLDGQAPPPRAERKDRPNEAPTEGVGHATPARRRAWELLTEGESIERVMEATGRARSTVFKDLTELVAGGDIRDISFWVDDDTVRKIMSAAASSEDGRLKPIFEALDGTVPYDVIALTLVHFRTET